MTVNNLLYTTVNILLYTTVQVTVHDCKKSTLHDCRQFTLHDCKQFALHNYLCCIYHRCKPKNYGTRCQYPEPSVQRPYMKPSENLVRHKCTKVYARLYCLNGGKCFMQMNVNNELTPYCE